ncbi:MAG: thermonuclease family protein [Verrucomicrobiaceae bacterium]|nr:thermonuclease family protein [Verrucomicrobiaceae bacterium]
MRTLTRWLWALLIAVVAVLQFWERANRVAKPPRAPEAVVRYETLQNARLVDDNGNDGDSFKIAHAGGEHVFRLHFVDCPEKRDYALVSGRLKDQAEYFGGISVARAVRVGQTAKLFTEKLLREGRFTVHTRWREVYDSGRFYAMVFFDDGEELSEKLVRAGLCRIHTAGTPLPDGRSEFDFESRLRALEHEARTAKRGAWGAIK